MADAPLMAGKSVLVTRSTGGIGRATAIGLAALGARVGITGRDPARTEAAAAGIRATPGSPAVDAFAADLSVQAGVRRLAAQVLDTYPRLDVLVNNAGGFWAHRHVTSDGLERTFALNHLAPFLLTSLLLDRLTASAPARILTVASGAHARGRIDFDDLQGARNYSGQRAYSQSKLASVMFTYELARRLEGTGVTATVLHPAWYRRPAMAGHHRPGGHDSNRIDPANTVGSVDLRTTRNSSAGRVTNRLSRALSLLSPPGGTQSGCPSGYVRLRNRVR